MKAFALTPLLLTGIATAASLARFGNDQIALTDDLKIPGDNPLAYCAAPDDYLLTIDHVDLSPNPPAAGKNLTITASGTLKERVTEGAMVHIEVKYGLIKILQQNIDLCEQASAVDLKCPIEKGKLDLTKEVALPAQIPPGKYTVLADVYQPDGNERKEIMCLQASVTFGRQK